MRRTSYRRTHDADELHPDAIVGDDAYEDDVVQRSTTTGYYESLPSRINTVIFTVLLALEALLALRFTLVAFGANRNSGFVDFILDVSWPFVRPFDGAFNDRTWDEGVIEVSTLLAMGVWALFFAIIAMLVAAIVPRVYGGQDTVRRRRVTHLQ